MLSTNGEVQPVAVSRQKLLLIDDDPGVIASLRLLFEVDYDTYRASTVDEGLLLFAAVRPPIVILDLKLPDRNGIEALREIRRIDPRAAVVILTGYSTRLAAEESLRLGAMDYINKPFNADDLKSRIAKLLSLGDARAVEIPVSLMIDAPVSNVSETRELQNASAAFLHDVAGPLSCLMAGADLLSQKVNEKDDLSAEELAPLVGMMTDSVRFLQALVEQWRSFSNLHVLLGDRCDVQKAVDLAVSQVMEMMSSSNVVFQIQSQRQTREVAGNHFALARVLINLLKNAHEAVSPAHGRIHLTVASTDDGMQLVVSDNGPGISEAQMSKLFSPQFTTKANGRGLGLFISRKIIDALGGRIEVRSPGAMMGADFTITLPLV